MLVEHLADLRVPLLDFPDVVACFPDAYARDIRHSVERLAVTHFASLFRFWVIGGGLLRGAQTIFQRVGVPRLDLAFVDRIYDGRLPLQIVSV